MTVKYDKYEIECDSHCFTLRRATGGYNGEDKGEVLGYYSNMESALKSIVWNKMAGKKVKVEIGEYVSIFKKEIAKIEAAMIVNELVK